MVLPVSPDAAGVRQSGMSKHRAGPKGRGEGNRRTRLDRDLDPRLKDILHTIVRAHAPLCRAERVYENPRIAGEADAIRRAARGCRTILFDMVQCALEELYTARAMLRELSGGELATRDELEQPGDDRGRETLDVQRLVRAGSQNRERLTREPLPLRAHVARALRRADRDRLAGGSDAAEDECVEGCAARDRLDSHRNVSEG